MTSNEENKEQQSVFKEEVAEASATSEEAIDEKSSTGLDPKVAGLLSYLAGFITGIIFFILEKENRFVRFHALQSIFVSIAIFVLSFVFSFVPFIGWLFLLLLSPLSFILWIVLMVQAYQGKWLKLPIIGDMAEKQVLGG